MAKFCGQCGTQLPDEATFCMKCGAKQDELGETVSSNERKIKKLSEISEDYMYEDDYREDIYDTVVAASSSLSCVSLKNQMSSKQIKNALEFCNNDFSVSDIILVRDTTDFGSMKEGLIITYFAAYYIWNGKMQSKVKFNQIKSMSKLESYGPLEVKFELLNGRENIFKLHTTKPAIIKLFKEICDCVSRYREDCPITVK